MTKEETLRVVGCKKCKAHWWVGMGLGWVEQGAVQCSVEQYHSMQSAKGGVAQWFAGVVLVMLGTRAAAVAVAGGALCREV